MSDAIDELPSEVVDVRGRTWTRTEPVTLALEGDLVDTPAGWINGRTTYFSLEAIADAYGPLTLPDGSGDETAHRMPALQEYRCPKCGAVDRAAISRALLIVRHTCDPEDGEDMP